MLAAEGDVSESLQEALFPKTRSGRLAGGCPACLVSEVRAAGSLPRASEAPFHRTGSTGSPDTSLPWGPGGSRQGGGQVSSRSMPGGASACLSWQGSRVSCSVAVMMAWCGEQTGTLSVYVYF